MNPSLGNRYSQHSFATVPTANIKRSVFNRSFAAKDTMDFDYLNPFFIEEVLPGDTMNLNVKTFMRLANQAKPMMDNMHVDFYFFYVPNRLVMTEFVRLMGEQENPEQSIDILLPNIAPFNGVFEVGSIADKFGLPTDVNLQNVEVGPLALPFRMYNLIYNQWFRDQNLEISLIVPKDNGPDPYTTYTLQKAAKKHDYFTSALPFLQKGDPVNIPLSGTIPVFGDGNPMTMTYNNATTTPSRSVLIGGSTNNMVLNGALIGTTGTAYFPTSDNSGPTGGLEVNFDLPNDVIMTINGFRQAMQLQAFLETDARGGTRYNEIVKAHFNVDTGDARLQRAEFLSGATINIGQHVVPQTSETGTSPQGNLAAYSTASEFGNKIGFAKSFVEHGFVIGLCRARGDVTYQQGMHKMWQRRSRYDYFWPEFQMLGEQAILRSELYFSPTKEENDNIFGYQERYGEYRYRPSEIRGQFRSTFAESLDVWHLAEEFATPPALNPPFIKSNTPIERALVVAEGYPHLLCDYWFDLKHVRPMVANPVPASLTRF